MSTINELPNRKQIAAERAEQIRLGLQSSAVLYEKAVAEEDWKVLSYASEKAWATAEFSPDRFSTENRKRLVGMYDAWGWSQRQIAAATGVNQSTVARDQAAAARDANASQEPDNSDITTNANARQQAAREREARARQQREAREAAKRETTSSPSPKAPTPPPPTAPTQPKDKAMPTQTRGPVDSTGKRYNQAELDTAALKAFRSGKSQSEFAHEIGIIDNSMTLASAWRYATMIASGYVLPWKNLNGKSNDKRLRELRAEKKGGSYLELIDAQIRLAQMCLVLETIHIQDYGLQDIELWKITDIYDDLVSLGEWYTRQLSAVQGYLGQFPARERIAKLRNVTGRTPEEAATALRLADRLERSLENGLS